MTQEIRDGHLAIVQAPWKWREALRRYDLPASALRVGLALIDEFANRETGALFPSFEAIAAATGMPTRTVRSGVDALRGSDLIQTRKSRFDGSLDYFFMLRTDANLSVREGVEVTDSCRTKGRKSVTRSDINLSVEGAEICHLTLEDNLITEPENVTFNPSCGPADDALRASPLRSESSSLRFEASASVCREPVRLEEHLVLDDLPIDESEFGRWIRANIPDPTFHREALRLLRERKMTPDDLRRMAA